MHLNIMIEFSVIEVNDNQWSKVVKKCKKFDFYHTQSYHLLEKDNRPLLFSLKFDDEVLALPLIVRKIPKTEMFDCTSAYGYCGPISSVSLDLVSSEIILEFHKELINFFNKNNIIAVFSRLHPLNSKGMFFNEFGIVKDLNKTIAIDLRLTFDEQRKQFRKSNKSELNQLRRNGYEVRIANSKEDIDVFIAIYNETMERVAAKQEYLFDDEYFYQFLNNTDFTSKLFLATFENKIIAGAIFTITNKVMQYHLSGTTQEFIRATPMKLIIDEARILGNELQLEFLHLGGGVGGSDNDSLFNFKSGFSKFECQYQIWQMIIDQNKYDELVIKNGLSTASNFFPLYRA